MHWLQLVRLLPLAYVNTSGALDPRQGQGAPCRDCDLVGSACNLHPGVARVGCVLCWILVWDEKVGRSRMEGLNDSPEISDAVPLTLFAI
jgi:hypothetical protein